MGLSFGDKPITGLFHGTKRITALYLGGEEIWPESGRLRIDPLSVAITFLDVTLYTGWLEVDTLATTSAFPDVTPLLTGLLQVDSLAISATFPDVTLYKSWLDVSNLATAVTFPDAALESADLVLLSGAGRSGDNLLLSGTHSGKSLALTRSV